MRCPSCGTENTPDSRFCGGCGAKLFPSDPAARVAPTAKISDDAPFPPSIQPGQYVAPAPMQYASSGPASMPPSGGYAPPPPSMPPYVPTPVPGSMRAPSAPPGASRANTAPPARSMYEPSMSIPVQTRPRWGLIALVLVLDIGLATAGAILLGKGLAKPERSEAAPPKSDPPPAGSAHADVAPAGNAAIAAPPPSGGALGDRVIAAVQPPPAPADAGVTVTPPSRHDSGKKKPSPTTTTTTTTKPDPKTDPKPGGPSPQDPYDPMKALTAEIELQASRAQGAFDQCYVDASAQGPIHGEVHIAFHVLPDGRVANVAAIRNDPNSGPLAGCLTAVILRWSFAAHPATASSFVRPFIYP